MTKFVQEIFTNTAITDELFSEVIDVGNSTSLLLQAVYTGSSLTGSFLAYQFSPDGVNFGELGTAGTLAINGTGVLVVSELTGTAMSAPYVRIRVNVGSGSGTFSKVYLTGK